MSTLFRIFCSIYLAIPLCLQWYKVGQSIDQIQQADAELSNQMRQVN